MIMEGANFGSVKLDHHYDHENGAGLIAMESAEALRDIFESVFYVPNTCEIKAALEGVSVEESSQASVMEASLKGAFEKIKQFFINLKEKVKEFLHNIKRFLTGMFGNDEKWVKTYEKELKALSNNDLKGYKVNMYNYRDGIGDLISKADIQEAVDNVISSIETIITDIKSSNAKGLKAEDIDDDKLAEEGNKFYRDFVSSLVGEKIDVDEMDKKFWSVFRNGADDESDMDAVEVSSIKDKAINALKEASKVLSSYDSMISKCDSAYNKAIKMVNNAEKQYNNLEANGAGTYRRPDGDNKGQMMNEGNKQLITKSLHVASSTISKIQAAHNKYNNAAKSALIERNAAYKKALTGAFGYARKNKGGK